MVAMRNLKTSEQIRIDLMPWCWLGGVTLLYFDGHYEKPYLTTTGGMYNESNAHASEVQ